MPAINRKLPDDPEAYDFSDYTTDSLRKHLFARYNTKGWNAVDRAEHAARSEAIRKELERREWRR